MFIRTTSINKILALTKRKKVIQGGTSASKTYSIIAVLIDTAIKKPLTEISIVSETIPHLRRGANKDFIKIMKETGRWNEDNYNKTLLIYTFSNGSYIEFFSAEQEDRLVGARRNILYINEANNITFGAYHQMAIRTSGDIYIDFNPSEEFWVHTELIRENDCDFIILTYVDNEALPDNVLSEFRIAKKKAIEESIQGINGYWSNWCRVYIEGEIGSLMGAVFNNWRQVDDIPEGAKFISDGLDYGFTNDPTSVIGVWLYNNELYVHEWIYETGLTNPDISKKLKGLNRVDALICESAEPKSNEELRRLGHRVIPCNKAEIASSVNYSINLLQQYPINITKSSINTIKEFRTYKWMVDKHGKATNEPVGYNDHSIAALRYVAMLKLNKTSQKKVQFGRI